MVVEVVVVVVGTSRPHVIWHNPAGGARVYSCLYNYAFDEDRGTEGKKKRGKTKVMQVMNIHGGSSYRTAVKQGPDQCGKNHDEKAAGEDS